MLAWHAVFRGDRNELTVSFLDIGQGDSIFIESPGGTQVLVDAGPDKDVLRELGKVMPFYDRSIDVVIATHPDADHIGGIPDVLKRFKVGLYIETDLQKEGGVFDEIHRVLDEKKIRRFTVDHRSEMLVDHRVLFDILFPVVSTKGFESNTSSIVLHIAYGDRSFMLTGDSPKRIERYLVLVYGDLLQSDVLKAGHHGSRTSSDELFAKTVAPEYVVISAGCDNRYGHPHKEVIDLFENLGSIISRTCGEGTITFTTDGSFLQRK